MKIVVGGIVSLPPFSPGTAWDRLHYVLGLRMLGHKVVFVEEVAPDLCLDYDRSVNRSTFVTIMSRFGLLAGACQIYDGGRATAGLTMQQLEAEIAGADLLVNISGHVTSELVLGAVGRRVYLDQDPVYTQLWDAAYGVDVGLDRHEVLLTVGANVGRAGNPVPDGGRVWHRTLPPVILAHWPFTFAPDAGRFTTVSSWGRYADLSYESRSYGSKRDEFMRFRMLPSLVSGEFELAVRRDGDEGPATALQSSGWVVRDAADLATLDDYRAFIAHSRAEIAIAKGAYVSGRAGWLGDRSSHYLASGKPVLAQSTGLDGVLPTGEGLVTFSSLEEAVAGAESIDARYEAHCRSARRLAEEYLAHDVVLPALLETALATSRPPVEAEV
jgi:hypothetical protein